MYTYYFSLLYFNEITASIFVCYQQLHPYNCNKCTINVCMQGHFVKQTFELTISGSLKFAMKWYTREILSKQSIFSKLLWGLYYCSVLESSVPIESKLYLSVYRGRYWPELNKILPIVSIASTRSFDRVHFNHENSNTGFPVPIN